MENTELASVLVLSVSILAFSSYQSPTGAYFSDAEASYENSIGAWVENPPDCNLQIDATKAKLTANGLKLTGIAFNNLESSDIIIDKIGLSWREDRGEKTERIAIGGPMFWEGSASSGETLDGEDYALAPSDPKKLKIWFSSDNSAFHPERVRAENRRDICEERRDNLDKCQHRHIRNGYMNRRIIKMNK